MPGERPELHRPPYVDAVFARDDPKPGLVHAAQVARERVPVIPERVVERRARWVLDTIGARELGFGDDLCATAPRRGSRSSAASGPQADDLAEAFFHLARVEERNGARDEHDRFRAASSCLDPLDPPLERLRRRTRCRASALGRRPLRRRADPRRRRRRGSGRAWASSGAAARAKSDITHGARCDPGLRELRGLAGAHRCTSCAAPIRTGASTGSSTTSGAVGRRSTFFLLAEPRARARRRRGRGVRAAAASPRRDAAGWPGAEVGLHGSYSAADDARRASPTRRSASKRLVRPIDGQRYHYLRVDPHRNLAPLEAAGFAYDSSLGFGDAVGFRAGIAHPFRPWDFEREAPHDLIRGPTRGDGRHALRRARYLNLSVEQAGARLERAPRLGRRARRRLRGSVALRALRLGAPAGLGPACTAA